jgi:hypothetical protein
MMLIDDPGNTVETESVNTRPLTETHTRCREIVPVVVAAAVEELMGLEKEESFGNGAPERPASMRVEPRSRTKT